MSRFGAIETSATANLVGVAGIVAARAVPSAVLFNTRPEVGEWPTALLSIVGVKRTVGESVGGHTTLQYTVDAAVLILANDDGAQVGGARTSAWTLVDAVMDAFTNWTPSGFSAGTVPSPCIPGDPVNILNDTGEAGIYLPLEFKIIWRT